MKKDITSLIPGNGDGQCSKCGSKYYILFSSKYWKEVKKEYTCPDCIGYNEDFYLKEFNKSKKKLFQILLGPVITLALVIFIIGLFIFSITKGELAFFPGAVFFLIMVVLPSIFIVRGLVLFMSGEKRIKLQGISVFIAIGYITGVILLFCLAVFAVFSLFSSDWFHSLTIPAWLGTIILIVIVARWLLKD